MNHAQNNFKASQAKIDNKASPTMVIAFIAIVVAVAVLFAKATGG